MKLERVTDYSLRINVPAEHTNKKNYRWKTNICLSLHSQGHNYV